MFNKVFENLEQHFPFVLFANPNETILKAYFQKNNHSEVFDGQSGFVFAPFLKEEVFIISESNSLYLETPIDVFSSTTNSISVENSDGSQQRFDKMIENATIEIKKNTFKKVVLSRKIEVDVKVHLEHTFHNILEKYSNTFRYLLYHPKFGIWMGATPERLLQVEDKAFKTVSLAGTQLFTNDLHWQTKEKQEQQYVTDYITSQLKPLAQELKIGNATTIQAGNIAHIKTNIEGTIKTSSTTSDLINALHPTPAVCGLPKKEALDFIIANENYSRSLYSGFLGTFNTNSNCDLYVNLRCMEIKDNSISIYVGCGITEDSDATLEYQETCNKAQTMLKIIKIKE